MRSAGVLPLISHSIANSARMCSLRATHFPLYRQAEIDKRAGVDIDRGPRAEWLGHVAWLPAPSGELIVTHVLAGRVIHADDTPVPVLAPGAGKTKTGWQWMYLPDERPHQGSALPAVLYSYTPDRKGEHCRAELAAFTGWLHADGYAGFAKLYEVAGADRETLPVAGPPRIAEVACWAHMRRYFFDELVNRRASLTRDRRSILTRGGARLSEAEQCRFNALPLAALLS